MIRSSSTTGRRPARGFRSAPVCLAWLLMVAVWSGRVNGNDSLSRTASWESYDVPEMEQMFLSGLEEYGLLPAVSDRVVGGFTAAINRNGSDSLDAFAEAAAEIAPVLTELVAQCPQRCAVAAASIDPSAARYAAFESLPEVVRMSMRTWLGRELVRQRLYDEAMPVLAEVDPVKGIDPASTLFFRGVCYHALLMKQEALADLRRLLEQEEVSPVRFVRTAQLMVADIKPLKEDSLDEISRLMTDVTRRLDLGRADDDVKKREQKIIDKLGKLIEEIEEQQRQMQQQMQQAGSQGSGGGNSGSPMQDSQIAGGAGAGDVDRKRDDEVEVWGNLPPAERQQALQQISRDLPTHYREAIEAYFRKLATDGQ